MTIPSNREVLHVLPRDFSVDGQEGVKDPLGMSAVRLEVETHIVHGSATALQNLTKCVRQAGVRVDELVVASLASGEAVLSETERELGVAVADIGAGTTDLALYMEGSPFHTSVLPLGGINVTNDVAIGLKTNLAAAEQLKIRFGTADPQLGADPTRRSRSSSSARRATATALRLEVAEIIEARMREVFEKIGEEMTKRFARHRLPAGPGADRRRLAAGGHGDPRPRGAGDAGPRGLAVGRRRAHRPPPDAAYATSIGLLLWAARVVTAHEPQRYESAPAGRVAGQGTGVACARCSREAAGARGADRPASAG